MFKPCWHAGKGSTCKTFQLPYWMFTHRTFPTENVSCYKTFPANKRFLLENVSCYKTFPATKSFLLQNVSCQHKFSTIKWFIQQIFPATKRLLPKNVSCYKKFPHKSYSKSIVVCKNNNISDCWKFANIYRQIRNVLSFFNLLNAFAKENQSFCGRFCTGNVLKGVRKFTQYNFEIC